MFYELEVVESSEMRSTHSKEESIFRAELRFIEKEGGSALVLVGPTRKTRVEAELDMKLIPFTPTERKNGTSVPREFYKPEPK